LEDLFLGGQSSIILGYRRLSVKSLLVKALVKGKAASSGGKCNPNLREDRALVRSQPSGWSSLGGVSMALEEEDQQEPSITLDLKTTRTLAFNKDILSEHSSR
jgi:hypothetical protein